MDKININTANEKELKKLPGVGDVVAKKILAFRDTGGTFNSFEEVKKVANIRSSYLDSLKSNLGFAEVELVNPNLGFDKAISIDPRKPLVQFPLPVFNSYSFKVKLKGSGNANLPDLKGYKLIVGYSLGAFRGFGKTTYTSKTLTYNLGSKSSQRVNIGKPLVRSSFIKDTFNLLIVSPTGKNIFDSSFEIDEDAVVEIGLPVFAERELGIKLNKKTQINYAGYQLVVNSKINRSTSGIEMQTEKFEIASANSFLLKFDPFGDVLDIKFEVLSPDNAIIFSETKEWDKLTGSTNKKKNDIALPSPTNVGYTIKLVIDPDQLNNPYLDHKVIVKYELIDPNTLNYINQIEKIFSIASNGRAAISIDYYGLIEHMEIDVKAPSGEIIGNREIELPLGSNNIEIKVPPKDLAGIEGFESLPTRPKKITGRVIDLKGDRKFENVQVIINVSTKKNPGDNDFIPLLITDTVKDGYLIFDTPNNYFTEAFASIGIPKKGNIEGLVFKVPIRLETDKVTNMTPNGPVLVDKLFFPPHIILVVDVESMTEEEDCDCNDCGDLDFHRPKKVVDEFSFYTVVRTTEPNIQGYVLDDDGEMSIQEILNVVQLADEPGSSTKSLPIGIQNQTIRKNILMKHINDKRGLTITTLTKALNESNALKLRESIRPKQEIKAYGRHKLDLNHAINWDENPKIYQATTLSHGHLLHFKQEWVNDGYGMGDLLYSLPLAPGQKKQIVVYDWERRESAAQIQSLDYQDSLNNSLSRDRDVNEIVTGSLSESTRGGSSAKTSSFGAGLGIGAIIGPVGALLGVAGGSSKASSSAWQNSSRNTSLNDLQQLRDRTVQSANSVRSQRSTVIATATQGERFSVETEVVANYNHCHSLTIQYFEVLRHMLVQQRLSSVQECLFIPLILDTFDHQKTLRWREDIQRYIRNRRLRKGFDAIERIENDYEGSDLPEGTYAQENLEYLEGGIYIKFNISSPIDLEFIEKKSEIISEFNFMNPIVPNLLNHIDRIFKADAKRRNALFIEEVAPEIAAAFVENLTFEAVVESSQDGTETTVILPVDTTLITRFNNGHSHYVTLRQHSDFDGISRESIKAINITKAPEVIINGVSLVETIPKNSKIIITSGSLTYRTAYSSGRLFSKSRILDDLLGYGGVADENERVRIATPLSRQELRNPRNEDLELANKLQDHLNDNLEAYHKVIWMSMSSERRFMFLDGIQVTDYSNIEQYPGGIIRSVASVVENRVIGVVGNSLVMPVAPGFRLDPNTRGKDVDLLALYQPISPIEPINISIPTKGVFAEAVMGKCNSCEIKEEDRFWRWEESPIPDSPTAIGQVNTDSRRSQPLDTTAKDFPAPMINIQNAPAAPDPTGIAAAQSLLGTASFKDITGLEQNQKNALEALKVSLSTAQAFGTKAGDMAALGAQLDAIKKAKENKLLDADKAKEMTEKSLDKFLSGSISSGNSISDGISQIKQVKDMVSKGELSSNIGDNLTKRVLDNISKENTSILENPAIKERIEDGDSLQFSSDKGNITLGSEKGGDAVADKTLLKFTVNFRRARMFTRTNGNESKVEVAYQGHFGFDWLRDEYVNPIITVAKDLDGSALNVKKPLCTDAVALKAEYLKGVVNTITPYGNKYYPAWLSIFPPRGIPGFAKGSRMHEQGVRFSLEIDEIELLDKRDNEIEFKSSNGLLTITPSKITLKDLLNKGTKRTKVLDAANGISRTYWTIEDAITLTSGKGVLNNHAEIRVIAKGSDKEEEVGKLMVYQNNRIPKAELVMVRVAYDDVNINLGVQYHDILKNQSFNQALIRAEVKADEKLIINNLDVADADVISFKANFPKGSTHNSKNFMNAVIGLYQKFGANNPAVGSKRSLIFITDEDGTSGGITESFGYAAGKFVWGNAVVVFGSNLSSTSSFVHEIGHSLSLAHTFDNDPNDAGILHRYYRGYTDNYMDYTTQSGGAPNTKPRLFFFKWQWDVMRNDQSLIG